MDCAVIGDSYVRRLADYVKKNGHYARRYNYFGESGMATNWKFEPAFQKMKLTNPRYVGLNVGGNNLRWNSDVYSVFTDIVSCVDRILRECHNVKGIWVLSIVERGKFPSWTGLTRTSFNRMRRRLNSLLKEHFEEFYIDVGKSVKFPKHFHKDLVHPSDGAGLKLLGDVVKRCFKPYE